VVGRLSKHHAIISRRTQPRWGWFGFLVNTPRVAPHAWRNPGLSDAIPLGLGEIARRIWIRIVDGKRRMNRMAIHVASNLPPTSTRLRPAAQGCGGTPLPWGYAPKKSPSTPTGLCQRTTIDVGHNPVGVGSIFFANIPRVAPHAWRNPVLCDAIPLGWKRQILQPQRGCAPQPRVARWATLGNASPKSLSTPTGLCPEGAPGSRLRAHFTCGHFYSPSPPTQTTSPRALVGIGGCRGRGSVLFGLRVLGGCRFPRCGLFR